MDKSISILKEHKKDEKRVVILPEEIPLFIEHGYTVYIEKGAGCGINIDDETYQYFGAKLVSREEAWKVSPFVVKYKAPIEEEFHFFNSKMNVCAIFHAEGNANLVNVLCQKKVTAYSYEFFEKDGLFPLAFVGSEISGKLAVIYGAYHLQACRGGEGILLADIIWGETPQSHSDWIW